MPVAARRGGGLRAAAEGLPRRPHAVWREAPAGAGGRLCQGRRAASWLPLALMSPCAGNVSPLLVSSGAHEPRHSIALAFVSAGRKQSLSRRSQQEVLYMLLLVCWAVHAAAPPCCKIKCAHHIGGGRAAPAALANLSYSRSPRRYRRWRRCHTSSGLLTSQPRVLA